ncbi:hypothetical protein CB1_000764029 [Camelus ferus]|nr:hypothetical protein CB1_000764029 [Camelus ferus]
MTGRARARARGRARGQETVQHVGATAGHCSLFARDCRASSLVTSSLDLSRHRQKGSWPAADGRGEPWERQPSHKYENNIMLCTDVSHKVLRSETVLDFMFNLYHQTEEHKFQEQVSKELIGLIVLTKYNNKTYRVDDIDWDQNPKSTFKKADGSEVSFLEYYRKQYNQEITDLKQPVLVSQPKRRRGPGGTLPGPAMLIPELCYLTGLTDKMRNDFNVMKDLAVHTRLTPEQRQREVGRLIDYIHKIEVDDRTEAYLRVLQQKVTSDTQIVVCLLSSNRKDKYDAIKKYLCTDCPTPSQCVVARTLGKQQTVMAIATKIALQMNCKMGGELWRVDMPLKLAMIVGIDCYHDTTAGRRSIAGFVASINEGMTRWFSRCVFQDRGQELVDGLKVCLQAALRAWNSCNEYMPSRIVVFRDGVGDGQLKALVSYEVPQFLDCLKSVGRGYNLMIKRVRDLVSQSFLPTADPGPCSSSLQLWSLPSRLTFITILSPRLTVIVVKKRVNARFFAQSGGRLQNPLPGTVIDVEVTRPEWYDFFIVSQAVRSGSVSPTHYNVIYDSSGLKPDHIQRLTYKLCHVYYNWPGVIRVPAPCQYAHKLAFLVGQSIHREPNLSLSNQLYYL